MARFTELFSEYITGGGALPPSFSNIEGFSNLFLLYYCDKEIGFETEQLFYTKLCLYADLYVDKYVQRINDLTSAWGLVRAPVKTHYDKYDFGNQEAKQTTLPVDATTSDDIQPNLVNQNKEYTNESTHEESGATIDEAQRYIDFLNKEVNSIMLDLLKKFETCFMGVYL